VAAIKEAVSAEEIKDDVIGVMETMLHAGEPVEELPGFDWCDGRRDVLPGAKSSAGVGA